ncbi:MAG: glycosyltransferase [Cytophagales bacterium]
MSVNVEESQKYLIEVAWEVCNQVGGIYTVIRSKVPVIKQKWGSNYCLIGPYFHHKAMSEFEPVEDYSDNIGKAVLKMREMGLEVHYGTWLISGKPKVVLINPFHVYYKMGDIKFTLFERHDIPCDFADELQTQVIAFGYIVKEFLKVLTNLENASSKKYIAHFHEWMVATAIPDIRYENIPVATVFTTHATLLGRYLAMNDGNFYDNLYKYYWANEARHFNIECPVKIERAAAHGAEVFTTVSDVTGRECESLLGRTTDINLPNGLNIQRFAALHEHQNLHKLYKDKIHKFVVGHFFQSYSFDLDNTLYFFTSGRFEFRNKGFDLTIEALARLNHKMKEAGINTTVVMFFITKRDFQSINPEVLQNRATLEEIRETCQEIQEQVGEKLFEAAAASNDLKMPDLNQFVDEYWRLRLRRTLQSWKNGSLPKIVTHNLWDADKDEVINSLKTTHLINNSWDKVKVVYHPDFITPSNPLFGMEYGQFVRGCHLGVFPSYYEPWGYTPLEAMASGVPAITSDLAGFGDYVQKNIPNPEEKGVYIVKRYHKSFHESAEEMANIMFSFVKQSRRDRIVQRNKVESVSEHFDWSNLAAYYDKAYDTALERKFD